MTEKRKRAEIYRKAARLLERRAASIWTNAHINYACEAIDTAVGVATGGDCDYCHAMQKMFAPRGSNAWLTYASSKTGLVEDDRAGRVLALCFMAAMVEAGDA